MSENPEAPGLYRQREDGTWEMILPGMITERTRQVGAVPNLDPSQRIHPTQIRPGDQIFAHRVGYDWMTDQEIPIGGFFVMGVVVDGDAFGSIIVRRDGAPDASIPAVPYTDGDLPEFGENGCWFAFYPATALDLAQDVAGEIRSNY